MPFLKEIQVLILWLLDLSKCSLLKLIFFGTFPLLFEWVHILMLKLLLFLFGWLDINWKFILGFILFQILPILILILILYSWNILNRFPYFGFLYCLWVDLHLLMLWKLFLFFFQDFLALVLKRLLSIHEPHTFSKGFLFLLFYLLLDSFLCTDVCPQSTSFKILIFD